MTQDNVICAMDLDHVLVNELGQFGRFQAKNVALTGLVAFALGCSLDYIFTMKTLPARCFIDECDNERSEYKPEWVANAIPSYRNDIDNCHRYNKSNILNKTRNTDVCDINLFNRNEVVSCTNYVFDDTNSAVYDFGIQCDEWSRTLINTISTTGILLALPITGYVSDKYGRKKTLITSLLLTSSFGISKAFSINRYMFGALSLSQSLSSGGCFSTAYLIGTELVGPKYRVFVGVFISSYFAAGEAVLSLTAKYVSNWRYLIIIIYAPYFLFFTYQFLLEESVRWLISKGKFEEAEIILLKFAKTNNKMLSKRTLEALFTSEGKVVEHESVGKIIRKSKILLKRTLITPVWWVTTQLVYYGLSINSTSLSGDMYFNFALLSVIEIPGFLIALFFLTKVGRRITMCVGYILCGIFQITFIVIGNELPVLSLVLYLSSKLLISMLMTSLYLYTSELYPTMYRHTFLAISSAVGRIGAVLAVLTPVLQLYWFALPSTLFGILTIVSACLVLMTPETLGTKLPDTIQEAESLGKTATT